MKTFDWRNVQTGEIVEHTHYSEPPNETEEWERCFAVAVGRLNGAGGSPGRSSIYGKEKTSGT